MSDLQSILDTIKQLPNTQAALGDLQEQLTALQGIIDNLKKQGVSVATLEQLYNTAKSSYNALHIALANLPKA